MVCLRSFQLAEKVPYFLGMVCLTVSDCPAFWTGIRAIVDTFGRYGLSAFGFRGIRFDYLACVEPEYAV